MIYLYTYLILSIFLTISTATQLKMLFGSLEEVVDLIRFADKEFDEVFRDMDSTQVVQMALVVGVFLAPVIALYYFMRSK